MSRAASSSVSVGPARIAEEAQLARARRRAEEAATVAAEAATVAGQREHERVLAEVRLHLETERVEEERRCEAVLLAQREKEHHALAETMARELEAIDRRIEERAALRAPSAPHATAFAAIEVRRKARLRVSASVLIDHFGTTVALPLVNASLTGALVSRTRGDLPQLRSGQMLFITLFATDDVARQVDLSARVVRVEPESLALDWSGDSVGTHALARLLDALSAAEAR